MTNLGVGGFNVGSVTPIAGNPPTAEQPISVGDSPDADAVDPANHLVYVANKESNTVSVIDGAAAQPSVIHTIPLPGYARPLSLASTPHPHRLCDQQGVRRQRPCGDFGDLRSRQPGQAYLDDPGGT